MTAALRSFGWADRVQAKAKNINAPGSANTHVRVGARGGVLPLILEAHSLVASEAHYQLDEIDSIWWPSIRVFSTLRQMQRQTEVLENVAAHIKVVLQGSCEVNNRFAEKMLIGTTLPRLFESYDCLNHNPTYLWPASFQGFEVPNSRRVEELIEIMHQSDAALYMRDVAQRISTLQNSVIEEEDDEGENVDLRTRGINPDSLGHFHRFLLENKNLRKPSVTITADKSITADWRESKRQLCTVYFLPDGNVRYLIFTPDPRNPDASYRQSGLVPRDEFKSVREKSSLDWLSER